MRPAKGLRGAYQGPARPQHTDTRVRWQQPSSDSAAAGTGFGQGVNGCERAGSAGLGQGRSVCGRECEGTYPRLPKGYRVQAVAVVLFNFGISVFHRSTATRV